MPIWLRGELRLTTYTTLEILGCSCEIVDMRHSWIPLNTPARYQDTASSQCIVPPLEYHRNTSRRISDQNFSRTEAHRTRRMVVFGRISPISSSYTDRDIAQTYSRRIGLRVCLHSLRRGERSFDIRARGGVFLRAIYSVPI